MEDELIFVLNTGEMKENGFEGSFNDFAKELEDEGAVVSGDYDTDGVPVMTVYGVDVEKMESMLSDYGIDNPSDFTSEVEAGDEFDFDEDEDADEEVIDVTDDDDELADEMEDELEDDDDEIIEIVDDDDDAVEESRFSRMSRMRRMPRRIAENAQAKKEKPKGTQNLSESVTKKILTEVKDRAIMKRILESFKQKAQAFQSRILNEQKREEKRVQELKESYPYYGVKVNGVEMQDMNATQISNLLHEAKFNYKKYYKKYKSLNESEDQLAVKYGKVLRKQHKLISLLEGALKYLNEDEALAQPEANAEAPATDAPVDNSNELSGQTATLTSIVFKVKNADDFIKTLVDNGIPEEALEKGGDSSLETEEEEIPEEEGAQDGGAPMDDAGMGGGAPQGGAPMGGAPQGGGNPFESLSTRLTKKNKLNEDDANPFMDDADGNPNAFGSQDQPAEDAGVDPTASETSNNAEEGEEVRLVDTSYAKKVQEILQDVYGFTKEQFEDKIGGQLEDDEAEADGSEDEAESNEDGTVGDPDKEGTEEEISPEDIFGDLDI